MKDERIPTPTIGYAVVRYEDREEDVIVLVTKDSAGKTNERAKRWFIVATSGVLFVAGQPHTHAAQPGDEVLITGEIIAPPFFPEKHGLVNLSTVPATYAQRRELN